MLSAYRHGTPASPFEHYCTSALAYFLANGHLALSALFATRAGVTDGRVTGTALQRQVGDGLFTDLTIEFAGHRSVVVEVTVEPGGDRTGLDALANAAQARANDPVFLMVSLDTTAVVSPWIPVTWQELATALSSGDDELAREFAEFIRRDVLGEGTVPLDQATTTNRLYALGAAAVRRRFGDDARYVNSASRPIGGRYRYLGTTFAVDGQDMTYWIGIVNEAVPLSDHYYLMLASKEQPVDQPTDHPRATADWKWGYWTTHGRVVRPVTADLYDALLRRIQA